MSVTELHDGDDPSGITYRLTDAAPELNRQLRQLDLVFTIDATGSMGPHIDDVRRRLKDLVSELNHSNAGPNMAVAVVTYRDHPPQELSYTTRSIPLGSVAAAQDALDTCRAEGGGDDPEAVVDGLADSIDPMEWRQRSLRIVVLVGAAPPHGTGLSGDGFPEGCPCGRTIDQVADLARANAVNVIAVAVSRNRQLHAAFSNIALATDGQFLTVDALDSVTGHILTQLQAEMADLSEELSLLDGLAAGQTPQEIARSRGQPLVAIMTAVQRLSRKARLLRDNPRFIP